MYIHCKWSEQNNTSLSVMNAFHKERFEDFIWGGAGGVGSISYEQKIAATPKRIFEHISTSNRVDAELQKSVQHVREEDGSVPPLPA